MLIYYNSDWVAQGFSWSISWIELKQLLKKKIGNYQVTIAPHQGKFQNRDCFYAEIKSIVKQGKGADAFYYRISFAYNYRTGNWIQKYQYHECTILWNLSSAYSFNEIISVGIKLTLGLNNWDLILFYYRYGDIYKHTVLHYYHGTYYSVERWLRL